MSHTTTDRSSKSKKFVKKFRPLTNYPIPVDVCFVFQLSQSKPSGNPNIMNGASASESESKPANRFEVLKVRQISISTDTPDEVPDAEKPADLSVVKEDDTSGEANTPRRASLQPPTAPVRARHVSVQSNGDNTVSFERDNENSITHDTYRKFDTTNLKTFGRNTHEAIPHMDFYRQTTSAPAYKRPTLEELHEEKGFFALPFFILLL